MPEIDKAVDRIMEMEIGGHSWNNMPGNPRHTCRTPCCLPRDRAEADKVLEEIRERVRLTFTHMIVSIDWKRIMLVASGRHHALHDKDGDPYDDKGPCAECIQVALLYDEYASYGQRDEEWAERPGLPKQWDVAAQLQPMIERPPLATTVPGDPLTEVSS